MDVDTLSRSDAPWNLVDEREGITSAGSWWVGGPLSPKSLDETPSAERIGTEEIPFPVQSELQQFPEYFEWAATTVAPATVRQVLGSLEEQAGLWLTGSDGSSTALFAVESVAVQSAGRGALNPGFFVRMLDWRPPPKMIEPKVITRPSARTALTNRMALLLETVLNILEHAAHRHAIPVDRVEVSGFVDPEDEDELEELVVTQWVRVPDRIALDYWDQLGSEIASWTCTLPPELERPAVERLAVEVRWDIDGPTF